MDVILIMVVAGILPGCCKKTAAAPIEAVDFTETTLWGFMWDHYSVSVCQTSALFPSVAHCQPERADDTEKDSNHEKSSAEGLLEKKCATVEVSCSPASSRPLFCDTRN